MRDNLVSNKMTIMFISPRLFPLTSAFVILFSIFFTSGETADILLSMPFPYHTSHVGSMAAIVSALDRHGHNVTLLTSSNRGTKGFKDGSYQATIVYDFVEEEPGAMDQFVRKSPLWDNRVKFFEDLARIHHFGVDGCRRLFKDEMALAKLSDSHFDIMIADVFDGGDALVYAYLKDVPLVAVTTSIRYPMFHEHIYGMPLPSSYVPFLYFPLSDNMSFLERLQSFFEHHLIAPVVGWFISRPFEQLKTELGISPDKTVQELLAEAEIWLSVSDVALDYPRPTVPNWIPIGGLLNKPAKPLTAEFREFINGAGDHGFIIFSLGSMLPRMPRESMVEDFARVFSELPQRVVWRCSGPKPRFLGNNTKLVDWLPQNDLLGHPNARLMIYHGGLNGVYEAIYHGVPMVIMPMIAEQPFIGKKIQSKGMGEMLFKEDVSYETVKAVITKVLNNPSYSTQARLYSEIHRDTLSKPDETAVFWIEHVLKYGGSHLRTRARELNFIQLNSIDVVVFLVVMSVMMLFLFIICCKRLFSCCKGSKKPKQD